MRGRWRDDQITAGNNAACIRELGDARKPRRGEVHRKRHDRVVREWLHRRKLLHADAANPARPQLTTNLWTHVVDERDALIEHEDRRWHTRCRVEIRREVT